MMVLVLLVYLYFQREDKRYIRRLNNRLMLNEETYRITARNSDTCVFTYDVETELIQFLNDKYKDIGLDQEQLSSYPAENISKVSPQSCADIRNILGNHPKIKKLPVRKRSQSGLRQNEIPADIYHQYFR